MTFLPKKKRIIKTNKLLRIHLQHFGLLLPGEVVGQLLGISLGFPHFPAVPAKLVDLSLGLGRLRDKFFYLAFDLDLKLAVAKSTKDYRNAGPGTNFLRG